MTIEQPPPATAYEILMVEAADALAAYPDLALAERGGWIVLEGTITLDGPEGPFDQYAVEIRFPPNYPRAEPKLFETGGRIPRTQARHVNEVDGSACYEVYEGWLAKTPSPTVRSFLDVPVRNFLISQTIFELKQIWPFGDWDHGLPGLIQSYAQVLNVSGTDIPEVLDQVVARLAVLRDWPSKGHYRCPCMSGKRFRDCHREEVSHLSGKISPGLAARMFERIRRSIASPEVKDNATPDHPVSVE